MDYEYKYNKYKSKYLSTMTGGKKKKKYEKYNLSDNTSIETNSMGATYTKHLSEPWFSLISLKLKTIEGRLNKGDFKEMRVGDIVEWYNDDFGHRSIKTRVKRKTEYTTFYDYLDKEGINKCLPNIDNINQGVDIYHKYYPPADEQKYGVIAIEVELVR